MPYALGIDVGTTFTSAAIWADGRVEVLPLESHRVSVPSVVFANGDGLLFGSAAAARGATEPAGAAREFKRRLGDSVPLVLSGSPYSADRLVAQFAAWVVSTVTEQRGESPERIVITHPANWTEFQTHLLRNALDQVGLGAAGFITEPQAAAIDFGGAAHLEPGELIVVYDLGGGTFDVAMLRRERVGFEHVGEPAGVERLGGIDFDEAIYQRVASTVPGDVLAAARTDQAGRMALLQLRRNCVEAKERLSEDVAADIAVLLPGSTSTVRVTRSEFEDMIRPMLHQTVEAVRHVLDSSDVDADELSAVLLVGGSSRIPAVSELVRAELGVPVRIDAHPKLVVARGAARWAGTGPVPTSPAVPRDRPRRGIFLAAIGAVVAVVAGAIALFAVTRDAESSDDTQPDISTTITATSPTAAVTTIDSTASSTDPPESAPSTSGAPPTTERPAERVVGLEFIGSTSLPAGTPVGDRELDGVTGLAADGSGGLVAVSDRTGQAEATLYDVEIDLADGRLDDGDVTIDAPTPLLNASDEPYGLELLAQSVAITRDGTVLVLSEGDVSPASPSDAVDPFLHEFDRDGRFIRAWPIPEWYMPAGAPESGIRPEGGFNSLTVTPDGDQVIAAVEYSLYQDETTTDYTEPKFARVIVYDAASRTPVEEHLYPLEPMDGETLSASGTLIASGLLDFVAVDETAVIAFERSLSDPPPGVDFSTSIVPPRNLLSVADLGSSTAATPSAGRPDSVVDKQVLNDVISDLGERARFKSLAFGPDLPDGRRSIILVSDNLFQDVPTTFMAYAVDVDTVG